MKIVLVNWARIWDGANYGGGVNGYCQSLALAMIERGHEVTSLFGGISFVPPRIAPVKPTPDAPAGCFIRRHNDWLGVRVFEVLNSPVMAPSIVQYREPLGEVSSPELEREVARLFEMLKPDIVHFHNIEGFSIGCVDAARAVGAGVIFSLHNYHTICPQVYLMQGHRRACHDSDAGHNCAGCIKTKPPALERCDRAKRFRKHHSEGDNEYDRKLRQELKGEWGGFKHEFTWPIRVYKRSARMWKLRKELIERNGPEKLPGHPANSMESVTRPLPVLRSQAPPKLPVDDEEDDPPREMGMDQRGQTQGILDDVNRTARQYDLEKPSRRPLLNVALPDPPARKPPNDYGRRRQAMVKMLSSCDRVLAVSQFVRDKFVAMGVDPSVIETMHIGSRMARMVERNREYLFDPPAFVEGAAPTEQRPVRLLFMGYNNLYKGLHVFADALELMTPDFLQRIDLTIHALDGHSIEPRFRKLESRLAKLSFHHGYQYQDIPRMLGGKDLGVVPSVWWDNAPQTVFEFLSCGVPVLGAAVGGIPDFVKDGENGVLFQGNNPFDLARRLAGILKEPWKLNAMRRNARPTKDIDLNADELGRVYAAAMAARHAESPSR